MDVLAITLAEAKRRLIEQGIAFSVEYTKPYTRMFVVSETWYVIRQRQLADGSLHLLAAAKMGKEVL